MTEPPWAILLRYTRFFLSCQPYRRGFGYLSIQGNMMKEVPSWKLLVPDWEETLFCTKYCSYLVRSYVWHLVWNNCPQTKQIWYCKMLSTGLTNLYRHFARRDITEYEIHEKLLRERGFTTEHFIYRLLQKLADLHYKFTNKLRAWHELCHRFLFYISKTDSVVNISDTNLWPNNNQHKQVKLKRYQHSQYLVQKSVLSLKLEKKRWSLKSVKVTN